ncbi:carboxylating nicotinate-nucleotide diphosphorylase [Candidatus Peregrinibacteria bacterium]|jgi:nicotinate-nucleotide pyrophosphorylase (carboxylating)|nr:carboxylating nicotinate-nucleotide diphosphorylase [Candidatus Peregrinibacteria bacterium]MBT4148268.1 carboxylating nicotinate-nucleotide diphosphorylase [Candidatus Peregrinibacteria bacterium]MBT4366560.1 carboxylating nicotinate-nucleotide diphosphorylase [Candidatus Peregrinibacteria bacterium]MBT4455961.1 carboxylating nicotinate-nucleotide diphosphorylase [Candidatus Peregrinibacteria bacterium]
MDRKSLKNLTHNAKDFLSVSKNDYKQWVFRYTFLELEKDLGVLGDITTASVIKNDEVKTAHVVSGSNGVLAGLEEIMYFLVDSDPRFRPRLGKLKVEMLVEDGARVKTGDRVMRLSGSVRDILAVERVALNLIMRMSGVATKTSEMVSIITDAGSDALVVPTRKTLWGLLDKKGCVLGGGGTHRLNLADAILIKDNHLKILGDSQATALKNLSDSGVDARFVEIEVEDKESAIKAAENLSSMKFGSPTCVLFDNMSATEVGETLDALKSKDVYDSILFEASGGISADNLVEYAKTGVDIISMGCLTMDASGMDFSLDID